MAHTRRLFRFVFTFSIILVIVAAIAGYATYRYIDPKLPDIEQLQDVQYSVPLRVFTNDGKLMAEFGEQRRRPTKYEDLPQSIIHAILATEDDRFFEHRGIDYKGLLRAGFALIKTGKKRQGGSTITMQVARNFFLSSEKTYLRKLNEIFLALKIERALTKQQILELYLNKIYFGQRAYGVGAAARSYYGVDLDGLTLPQIAMIAGLPKAPSANNPVSNPERALERRNYVLKRMYILKHIDSQQYLDAIKEVDNAKIHTASVDVDAAYVAEMVRHEMVVQYGEEVYKSGYRVVTTIDSYLQEMANKATQDGLLTYDRRHGYRGVEGHIDLSDEDDQAFWLKAMADKSPVSLLLPGLVISVAEQSAKVFVPEAGIIEIDWEGMSWASLYVDVNQREDEPNVAADILGRGDQIRVESLPGKRWRLAQIPNVEGALVSLRPNDGALLALTGGFDFFKSKFNRSIQAKRQPGSSFKPFIYAAALAKGFTTASMFNDAPVVFDDAALETMWRPENSSKRFYGPTRLRVGLTHSRNLVSIRLLRAVGIKYAANYVQRFGFPSDQIARDLSLALGSSAVTPMQMARGYSVFANGGQLVDPYFIQSVSDADGNILSIASPAVACSSCFDSSTLHITNSQEGNIEISQTTSNPAVVSVTTAPRVVPEADVYLMNSMTRDVVKYGTGKAVQALGRNDLSGKTGTTNDQYDAWFCGFNDQVATAVWVGFDQVQELGRGEYGGRAALPIWMQYMKQALEGLPERDFEPPEGVVAARIDPENGLLMPPESVGGIEEQFRQQNVPTEVSESALVQYGQFDIDGSPMIEGAELEPLF